MIPSLQNMISPLTRKRWRQFRQQRRGWTALLLLAALYALSLGAELLCNGRPLILRCNGQLFFPAFRYYSQQTILHSGSAGAVDYHALVRSPAFASQPGSFALFAPVRYGPHDVIDAAELESDRQAALSITPALDSGRFNLASDGRILRAESCVTFFPGVATIDGEALTNHWRVTPDLAAALAARLANQAAPALALTLSHRTVPALRAVFALAAYEPRSQPPASVRLAVRAETAQAAALAFQIRRRGNGFAVSPARVWQALPAAARTTIDGVIRRGLAAENVQTNLLWNGHPAQVCCTLADVSWPYPPTPGHWLGIDGSGRDVLARVVYGMRTSLTFGLLLVGWAMLLGFAIGAIQGYFGGWLDISGQRLIEIWSALPFLYVMILIGAVLGRSFLLLLLCYGLFNWIGLSYYMRAEFLRLRRRPFVEAARCQGLGHAHIIFRHILPNALTPMITLLPFELVGAIGSLAALDFLGFGLPALTPSWGELLQQAQSFRWAWWLVLYPAAALFTVMLLAVLVGEGLRDAFDPRPKVRLE